MDTNEHRLEKFLSRKDAEDAKKKKDFRQDEQDGPRYIIA